MPAINAEQRAKLKRLLLKPIIECEDAESKFYCITGREGEIEALQALLTAHDTLAAENEQLKAELAKLRGELMEAGAAYDNLEKAYKSAMEAQQ